MYALDNSTVIFSLCLVVYAYLRSLNDLKFYKICSRTLNGAQLLGSRKFNKELSSYCKYIV